MQQHPMRCSSSTSRVIPHHGVMQGHMLRQAHMCFATSSTSTPSRRRKRATTRPRDADAPNSSSSSTTPNQTPASIAGQQQQLQGAVQFGQPPPAAAFAPANGWVVFSDLHMSQKTMGVALQTLQRVHQEAKDRAAGVLFLGSWGTAAPAGDFWDRRGDLPVVPLNKVQQELSSWQVPLLLLPGNHDQVDLGGQEHALYPLQVAARCAHVFTQPTLFKDSLWLPYRRNEAAVRAAIEQAQQQGPLKAIFGHADVLTAHMNAAYQARDGLPPGLFPARVPVYLGHYHYPHTLPGTAITYIGSPFQVSASEAGQPKRLLLLDQDWQQVGEVPLDLGRRFFTFAAPATDTTSSSSKDSLAAAGDSSSSDWDVAAAATAADGDTSDTTDAGEVVFSATGPGDLVSLSPEVIQGLLQQGQLRRGDVVVLRAAEDNEELKTAQKLLHKHGVDVNLQLQPASRAVARIESAEQLSMQQLLEEYAANTGMPQDVLDLARGALQELGSRTSEVPSHSHLVLAQVTVEGFGPFRNPVSYPLAGRGVVAVTGRNEDDAAAVSNGSGKTSLLAALLWAFKAPDGRGLVSADYVNEDSKKASVTVTGTINGEPFQVIRSVNRSGRSSKSGLSLSIAGQDLTAQEQRLTEQLLQANFSTSLLPKTLVFSQEDLLALLQSGDAAFKDLLSSVVDTDVWQQAREGAVKTISALQAQLRTKEDRAHQLQADLAMTQQRLQEVQRQQEVWEQGRQHERAEAQHKEQVAHSQVFTAADSIAALQRQLAAAAAQATAHQQQLEAAKAAAHAAAKAAEAAAAEADRQGRLRQLQLQQEDRADDLPQQQQQQQQFVEFDESAAEAELQPLLLAEQQLAQQLSQQQGISKELNGQFTALTTRRTKYLSIQGVGNGNGNGHVAVATAAAVAAFVPADGGGGGRAHGGLAPVCEQCLQPINLDLYQRNLDFMAAEGQQLQQQLDASLQGEQQLQQQRTAAWQQVQSLRYQQAQQRAALQTARQQALAQMQEQQRLQRQQAEQQQAAERERLLEQQKGQQGRQRQIWEEDRRLERELDTLRRLSKELSSEQQALHSTLAKLSSRLNIQLPSSSTSGSTALTPGMSLDSAAEATSDFDRLVTQLCNAGGSLRQSIQDAADALSSARSSLQQLAASHNPHASGVGQLQQLVGEKQQQLQENQAGVGELTQQVSLWRRVDAAFGRTGIPSFVLESVLGELQAACSRHLSKLAVGMSLELSATSERKTAKKAAGPSSTSAGRGGQKGAAGSKPCNAAGNPRSSIDTADASEMVLPDSDEDSPSVADSLSAAAAGSGAALKEEIAKVIRVRAAGGEMRQRSVAQLSGGEKKRVALALGLGFAELAAARARLTSNVLVLDEVLEKLDEEGCACVASLLKGLPYSSVFVVGQANSFVTKEFASVDTVVKAGGCSSIEIGASPS